MNVLRHSIAPLGLLVLGVGFLAPACTVQPAPDDSASGGASAGKAATSGGAGGTSGTGHGGTSSPAAGTSATSAGAGGAAGSGGSTAGGAGAPSLGGNAGTSAPGGSAGAIAGGSGPAAGQGGAPGGAGSAAGGPPQAGTTGSAGAGAGAGGRNAGGAGAGGRAAGGAGGSAGAGGAGGAGTVHSGAWRIMPFGDSITGTTCYPQLLSAKLKAAGKTNFTFMGTNLNNQSCTDGTISNAPNVMTEGHGGYILSCLTGDTTSGCSGKGSTSELATWMGANPPPDVVLMHFGTNDVWSNIATSGITTAYTHALASMRGANPNVIVFVAQILPMHPDGCVDSTSSCPNNGVKALNAAIPAWASGASTGASPVYVVDIYGSIGDAAAYKPSSTLTADGVHPNAKGGGLMADAFIAAMAAHGIPN